MSDSCNNNHPKIKKLDSVEKYTRLFSAKDGTALSLKSGYVVLDKNEVIGAHSTEDKEEILIIIEGKGRLVLDGGSLCFAFNENEVLYIEPGTVHDVQNSGDIPLRYVYVTCPVKT
ncbi:MAG: cupin domain-containing protein [Candidatus Omnitrophica bacterium]|nr:cupin domain-containing protein [Candidatus Omnitrophota bacterium]